MADIRFLVEVDADGAVKSIKNFDGTLEDLKKKSGEAEGAHKSLWKQVALGQAAWEVAKKAGGMFLDFLKGSIEAAMEAEKAQKGLEAALESTGRPVESMSRHLNDYAQELKKTTVYDDEAIARTQALLVQLTNLDEKGLDAATKGAIGLASVMGMDLDSAATLVAKSMAGNTAVLSRYGISVKETGTAEEKRAELLDKLGGFYSRATAETETYGGKLAQLKNTYGDIKEAVGRLVTQNTALMDGLNRIASELLYLAEADDMLARKTKDNQEAQNRQVDWLSKAAVAAGFHYGQMAKLIEAYQGNTNALIHDINAGKHGIEIKTALTKVVQNSHKAWDAEAEKRRKATEGARLAAEEDEKAKEAKKKLVDEINAIIDRGSPLASAFRKNAEELTKLDKALKAGAIDLKTYNAAAKVLENEEARLLLDMMPVTKETKEWSKALENAVPDLVGYGNKAVEVGEMVKVTWAESAAAWVASNKEATDEIFAQVTNFTNQIDALSQASLNKKLAQLDKEYQARLENIKSSTMSEEQKNQAIEALEAEYNMKREQAQQKAAAQQKVGAIAQAIISTYEAAAKALTAGPIIGPILMGIITAMGLLQVAKIKATPLAEGAIFQKPVFSPGGGFVAGEAGYEAVLPLRELPRLMREIAGARGVSGMGGNSNIYLDNRIIIDGKEMKRWTTQAVQQAGRLGKLGRVGKEL